MEDKNIKKTSGHIWLGLLLLVIGGALIIQKTIIPLPEWLVSWKTLLIAIGLAIGAQHRFKPSGWIALVVIGFIFLLGDIMQGWSITYITWPIVLIVIGLWVIFRPRHSGQRHWHNWRREGDLTQSYPAEDMIDSVSIFSGIKKVILSKDWKGGEVTNFLGGTELDLTQADINGAVVLEVTQVMGGTKLIIPSHWDVQSELVSIFGGIEDKRKIQAGGINPEKVLLLKGTNVFGGIDIRSF